MKKIGVLTSGGDAPEINAAVHAVVRTALYLGTEVVGIIEKGGTILFSARSEEFKSEAAQGRAIAALRAIDVEGLVMIGGNGTQTGALGLHERGLPAVGVTSTIDNDLAGTDYTIGCDTASNTIVEAIDRLRDTASSHERTFLFETMGRKCGWLALQSGLATGAEIVLIPEVQTPLEEVADRIRRRRAERKDHIMIVVAEGFGSAVDVGRRLNDDFSIESRVSVLGHAQRGDAPTAFDRVLASRLEAAAVNALRGGASGIVMGLHGNEVVAIPTEEAISQRGRIDLDVCLLQGVFAI
ncbi:MAG: ATP-dependent 6-phosphofructokinase [Armatimonadetes bacterium]|nr:ATP-dependent 6-phosphofructokinase [Armatimonadota bacterium]